MKQRVLLLSVTAIIVCAVALSTALATNSLGHSHAMARSVTPQATTSHSSSGVVVGNTYYGLTGQNVYALNATTGALLWQHPTSSFAYLLTVAQGNVYFALGDVGDAYALNATTGAVVWQSQATINTVPSALFVNNGVLYVETHTEAVFFSALNASNGKLLWTYTVGSDGSSFVLVQGVLYIASSLFPTLCAVQVSNGSQIWCQGIGVGYGGISKPIVTGSIVTVGYVSSTYSYEIAAFNSSNGSLVWQSQNVYQLGGSQGMIYAAVAGSNVVEALNALNGALIWKSSIGTGNITQTGDIVRNGVLYTSNSNNEVDAISTADGSLLWHYNVGGIASLIIANGVVYARGSALYALNARNGSFLWKASISVGGGLCAVSVKLGIVYIEDSVISHPLISALSIQTGQQLWTY